jgi:magnesium transporter
MSIDKLILGNFFENHINEAVKTLSSLSINEIVSVINNLSDKNVYSLFSRIERIRASKLLELLDTEKSAEIIDNIPSQVAVIILRQLSKNKLESILSELSEKKAVNFTIMLSYNEFSAGAVMNPRVFTLIDDVIVKDALEDIKKSDEIILPQIFVVTRDQKLEGVVDLYKLIRSNPRDELRSLIDKNVPKIFSQTNVKSLIDYEGWQSYYSLPVTDAGDIFLGAISLESIRNFMDRKSGKELKQVVAAGSALGELYRIGLSGLVRSAAEITKKSEK